MGIIAAIPHEITQSSPAFRGFSHMLTVFLHCKCFMNHIFFSSKSILKEQVVYKVSYYFYPGTELGAAGPGTSSFLSWVTSHFHPDQKKMSSLLRALGNAQDKMGTLWLASCGQTRCQTGDISKRVKVSQVPWAWVDALSTISLCLDSGDDCSRGCIFCFYKVMEAHSLSDTSLWT